ncbi:MAG: hypothetical protein JRN15_19145, partial [Nitrososphaerota archaeon]|nr:hypothetical protein [Nitrososphaerota archaeon]
MNAILPNTELTGALSISEIFDYFDGPKLFVCENQIGQKYLGYWVGSDDNTDSYWIVAISRERYLAVRSAELSLHEAISKPELGYLLQCRVHFENQSTEVLRLTPTELDPALIPDPEQLVELKTETLETRMATLDLARKAIANQRDVLGIHFEFPGYREEGPTKRIGKLLIAIQELLDALGQKIAGQATLRGLIAQDILSQTETRLVQAAGGSFGLEVLAVQQVDLFKDSLVSNAIRELVQIIEIGDNVEPLRTRLIEMKPRAASKYQVLL